MLQFLERGRDFSVLGLGLRRRFKTMSARLQRHLLYPPLLQEWAAYSLAERSRIITEVWGEDSDSFIPVAPDTPLFFVVEAFCMGWSWALYFCQAEMEAAAAEALGPPVFSRDRPDVQVGGGASPRRLA